MAKEADMRAWQQSQADIAAYRSNVSLAVAIASGLLTALVGLASIFLKPVPANVPPTIIVNTGDPATPPPAAN